MSVGSTRLFIAFIIITFLLGRHAFAGYHVIGLNHSQAPVAFRFLAGKMPSIGISNASLMRRWKNFILQRNSAMHQLIKPVVICVKRDDTSHLNAAFHGCLDWHSAVHGTWALLATSRLTKNLTYAKYAEQILSPQNLAKELKSLQNGAHPEEIPYGYSWLLALTVEHRKIDTHRLAALGNYAASQLEKWLISLDPEMINKAVVATDYENISWALLNLWQYAVSTSDPRLKNVVLEFTKKHLLARDAQQCPLVLDVITSDSGFFPACLNRARAIMAILGKKNMRSWAIKYLPKKFSMMPVSSLPEAHNAGLNFSRSWGLYSLHLATGNSSFLQMYLDHFMAGLVRDDLWSGDYESYAHWVAQFGIYALVVTADEQTMP